MSNLVDTELNIVRGFLLEKRNFQTIVGRTIRMAIDEVVAGRYTGRYAIHQIDKTEKTYIGTKVQHLLQTNLKLPSGQQMDAVIEGIEVDIKFTIGKNWTIPAEAMNHLCLIISADDDTASFQVGLIRITEGVLNGGANRDGKRTLNKVGRQSIDWLIVDGQLPLNILLSLDPNLLESVFSYHSGQKRINELFRQFPGVVFNNASIVSVAKQVDSGKRVRDARETLLEEGIRICSGYDNTYLESLGVEPIKREEFIAIRL